MKNRSVLLTITLAVLALTAANGVLLVERHLEVWDGTRLVDDRSSEEGELQSRALALVNLDWVKPTGSSPFHLAKSRVVVRVSRSRIDSAAIAVPPSGQVGNRLTLHLATVVLRL